MANPIKYSDIFDFTNDKDVQLAIKTIKQLDKVYTTFVTNGKKLATQYAKNQKDIADAITTLHNTAKALNPTLEKDQKQLAAISKSMDVLTTSSASLEKKTVTLGESLNKLEKEQKQVSEGAKKTAKSYSELEKLQNKLASLNKKEAADIAKVRAQINQKNKELREEARNTIKLVSVYDQQVRRLAQLSKQYKEYVVQGKEGTRAAKNLKKEFDSLNASIRRADSAVGQHQRNVGNYKSAFAGAAVGARQLATALGFTGVIFALVAAFRNAFNVIKQFDDEMVNLAAIMGKSRDEISGVENEIRRVAKTSINTANDVAKTATALVTLGKTESEIVDLLEPVNQLSIALRAPADAAGELLIQTLNAFGESSSAAQRYADIIAKMRTSTALDFERIVDSLGYLAPVAKAVGLSLEETGAIIGVLVDNGIKAQRAGRLMSTSFGRLAQDGISLNDALNQINTSTDKTTTAMNLFGAESFALALILADNIEKTQEYAKTFEAAGGTLQDLTDKQLMSITNQAKLAKSAWDEFVLGIDKGDGVISRMVRGSLLAFTNLLSSINEETEKQKSITNYFDKLKSGESTVSDLNNEINSLESSITGSGRAATKQREQISSEIDTLKSAISAYETYNKTKENANKLLSDGSTELELNNRKSELESSLSVRRGRVSTELQKQLSKEREELLAISMALDILAEKRGNDNDNNNDNAVKRDGVKASQDLAAANDKLAESQEFVFETNEELIPKIYDTKYLMDELKYEVGSTSEALNEYSDKWNEAIDKQNEANMSTESLKTNFTKFEKFLIKLGDEASNLGLKIQTSLEAASIAVNQFFTNQSINRENAFAQFEEQQNAEIDRLEEKRERELENENLTAEQKRAINQRYANSIGQIEDQIERRRERAQRKAARAAKAQAIFNATIDTARAVTNALASLPPPANLIAAKTVGILGGIQIAAIASQPLPKFAKGTDNAPGGLAIVGEKGRELIMEPSGKTYLSGDKSELRDVPKGSKILTNAITERILKQGQIDNQIEANNQSASRIRQNARDEKFEGFKEALKITLERENDNLVSEFSKSIGKLPLNNWTFNDKGHPIRSIQKGNTIRKQVRIENKY